MLSYAGGWLLSSAVCSRLRLLAATGGCDWLRLAEVVCAVAGCGWRRLFARLLAVGWLRLLAVGWLR